MTELVFTKGTTKKKLVIPNLIMEQSGFEKGKMVEIHALTDAVVILKKEMTAMELVHAIDQLQRMSTDLTVHLAQVCGPCEGCDGECDIDLEHPGSGVDLPEWVRQEAGIPKDAKLCAWPKEDGVVCVEAANYRYDLSDVPPNILDVLAASGVCLNELEELLMTEETVYG